MDLLYLYIRFTASRHNQLDESIASALDLLYLCSGIKIKCVRYDK